MTDSDDVPLPSTDPLAPAPVPGPDVPLGPQFAPPPPARRTFWQRFRRQIIAGALLIAICGSGGAYLLIRAGLDVHDAAATVSAYVKDLQAEDYPAAYELLCATARREVSPANLAPPGHIVSFNIVNTTVRSKFGSGEETGVVYVTLTLADNRTLNHIFPVVKEGGDWKVCN